MLGTNTLAYSIVTKTVLVWDSLSDTNALAYINQIGRKLFIALTPGANVVKLFFFVTDERAKTSEIVCPWQAFPA